MADLKARPRPVGATAVLGRTGFPHVTVSHQGRTRHRHGAVAARLQPADLLYASLSACLVLSAPHRRQSARHSRQDHRDHRRRGRVRKQPKGRPGCRKFNIAFSIKGDLDEETRLKIAHAAEDEICTVSNTIRGTPEFSTVISG